ncbi:sugar phosphate isomerase/epimerase family protein [Lapidilactobacillus bayanensis]|uniref:sugar phosphate isomerase/epimerase family protein n=1 Tax=Lapidilactobacillus bayanensis TaxID=2485998 RepID=UPI000F7933AA|nr:TIM barrel protein [Lapidilactobacillus bayanensis]
MTADFTISAFADEISPDLMTQIKSLKANGISHIELRGIDGKNVSDFTVEEANNYQQIISANDMSISSIGSPIGKIGINDDFSDHLDKFKHVLKIARIFKAPYVRMFSFFIPKGEDPDQYTDEVINRWQQFLEVAKDYPEITLLHENEKEIYGDTPERCLKLLQALDSEQVKTAFDPANFVQCEVETYPYAYNLLKDKIVYMHIKDAKYADHEVYPAGLGDGQVALILQQLVETNYSGFLSIEPHLSNFVGFEKLEKQHEITKKSTDGERLFDIAANSLKQILVADLGQDWK